jgi:exodeoxyribonuclease III
MRIASFNINNINRRLPNLLEWLRETEPDVVSLQGLKATDAEFPAKAIRDAGYEAVWRGQKSWNGVAILARWPPILTCGALPGGPADAQSRYIEAAVKGVLVASLYAPNRNRATNFAQARRWRADRPAVSTNLRSRKFEANCDGKRPKARRLLIF